MEFLYFYLQKIGFSHPIHPALIHIQIGLVIGAFIFMLIALVFKRENYPTTARRCAVLSLTFLFPASFLGVTDWWYFYAGAWSVAIKIKFALTGVLVILLSAAIVMETKKIGGLLSRTVIYFLCVAAVTGLGYFGAELIYPGRGYVVKDERLKAGETLYIAHCAGCHPKGGNSMNIELPVVGPSHLRDPKAFASFNRRPLRPDGSKGLMPAYPEDKISDEEMTLIYRYVTNVLVTKRPAAP